MAMRTIKIFDSPGGRFTLEEALEAARALKQPSLKRTAADKPAKKAPAKKAPVKKAQ
jgi:hypothetical protein